MAGRPRFVLGITTQLVVINSNCHLSRIVRNLAEPLHCSNRTMECDGYDEHGKYYLAMVTIVMLLNDIPHVCHMLVANLEMNSYN